jgi:hypothetical protein
MVRTGVVPVEVVQEWSERLWEASWEQDRGEAMVGQDRRIPRSPSWEYGQTGRIQ